MVVPRFCLDHKPCLFFDYIFTGSTNFDLGINLLGCGNIATKFVKGTWYPVSFALHNT